MDLLENYKKAWDNQPEESNKFSAVEIYKLAHSKSSSIVKWIFIIGILEFVILNSVYFFVDMKKVEKEYATMGLDNFMFYSNVVAYVFVIYFLVMFYRNYKKISVIDSTKVLMKKILKTRKTVRSYVVFNLVYVAILMVIVTVASINTNFNDLNAKQIMLIILLTIIITILLLGVLFLFYKLLYGILLKKLNRNYKELAKLDEI